jgi:hypothetical protein
MLLTSLFLLYMSVFAALAGGKVLYRPLELLYRPLDTILVSTLFSQNSVNNSKNSKFYAESISKV